MVRTIAIVFLSIVALSLELDSIELPLYGTITIDKETYFYINTEQYELGEYLSVEISFESDCYIKTLFISYCQKNDTIPGYMDNISGSQTLPSKEYSAGCIVQMITKSKYYIFKTPTINNCSYPLMTIRHKKEVYEYQFPVYGKGAVSRQSSLTLDIRNFNKNDNLTFKLLFINNYNYTKITLNYSQYYTSIQYKEIESFLRSNSGVLDIFYFKINLKEDPTNMKYLSLLLPEDIYKYSNATVWHTKNMPIYELKKYGQVQVSEQS